MAPDAEKLRQRVTRSTIKTIDHHEDINQNYRDDEGASGHRLRKFENGRADDERQQSQRRSNPRRRDICRIERSKFGRSFFCHPRDMRTLCCICKTV